MRIRESWSALLFACALVACDSSSDPSADQPSAGSGGVAGATGGAGGGGRGAGSGGSAASSAGAGAGGRDAGSGAGAGGGGTGGATPMDAAVSADGAPSDAGYDAAMASGTPYVYVSGYGSDIARFVLDPTTGALDPRGTTSGGDSPSYLAIAPNKRRLYAINETGGAGSVVIAFSIDPATGALAEINRAATEGEGSPHLAVHPSGNWVAVAHYGSGHTSILNVRTDGGVEPAVEIERGPSDDCGRAHQAVFDRSGDHLFVPCLESNYVLQFRFSNGTLEYNDPASVPVTGGPRHMAFDPDESHAYVLSESDSTITSFAYDAASGELSDPQTIDSQEEDGTKGASAHIVVHPSGNWLYASNRAENSLGLFSIDQNGRPQAVEFVRDMINTPRDFTVDPTGAFLISANQNGPQNLLVFRIDPADGTLTRVQVVPVGNNPTFASVVFLP